MSVNFMSDFNLIGAFKKKGTVLSTKMKIVPMPRSPFANNTRIVGRILRMALLPLFDLVQAFNSLIGNDPDESGECIDDKSQYGQSYRGNNCRDIKERRDFAFPIAANGFF